MELASLGVRLGTQRAIVALVERWGRAGAVSQGGSADASVALTFDDGPHPKWTPMVLDCLERAGAVATFFVVGRCVARCASIVRETRRRGHEIGIHLYSHDRSTVWSDVGFKDELERSRDQLESMLGERVTWLRFPYGNRGRQRPSTILAVHGLRVAHWTYSALDGRVHDPERIIARVAAGLRPGAIVLLHDNLADAGPGLPPAYRADRDATVAALPGLLKRVAERKLRTATLSTLFGAPNRSP